MIQAILQFQFVINLSDKGVIDPEFKPYLPDIRLKK